MNEAKAAVDEVERLNLALIAVNDLMLADVDEAVKKADVSILISILTDQMSLQVSRLCHSITS